MNLSTYPSANFEHVRKLISEGKYENALKDLKNIEKKGELEEKKQINCQILKSEIYNKTGKYEKALSFAEEALEKCKDPDDCLAILDATNETAYSYWRLGKLEEASKVLDRSEPIVQKLKNKKINAVLYREARIYRIKGVIHHTGGNLNEAERHYRKSLSLWEQIGDKQEISSVLNNLGVLNRTKGELHKALGYYQKSLFLYKEFGNIDDIATSLNNIGNIFRYQGELDEALNYYKQSLDSWEEIGNSQFVSLAFYNIGEVYQQKGKFDTAIRYFKQSLSLREDIGNKQDIAMTLFYLISASLDSNNTKSAQRYLDRLRFVESSENNSFIKQLRKIGEASLLKTSPRMKHRVEAQELLQKVLEEEIVDHSLTVIALIGLSELLLDELKISGDQEVFTLLQAMVSSLFDIAKHQDSHNLLVKTYWLQSQMALIDLDLEKARELLSKAQEIAERKGLRKLAISISSDHDSLLNQLSDWENLINKKAGLKERLEFAQLGGLVVKLIKNGNVAATEIINEEPILLIILSENGTPLYTKNYVEGSQFDGVLIGGFLAAIIKFSQETFASEGSIERIKHQEYTLLVKAKKPFLFSYVIKGQTYSAMQKLEALTRIIGTSTSIWDDLQRAIKTSKTISAGSKNMIDELAKMVFPSKA
ncbi:MAG: tetratricopeptide repeat protein [Candidatus Heimdallarchaeota archaeon]|nr:tetratricopeptide repeat protein [Candidatus Heimdallarchaeota archaeon]